MIAPCFSLLWLLHILVWIIIVAAVVAILRVVLPWALGSMGVGGPIPQVLNIVLVAIVLIALLFFVVDLLTCARIT